MTTSAPSIQPLSHAEIEELDAFLLSDVCPENAMDVSMMDGFITALVSGPNRVMPTTILRWIWDVEEGKALPAFSDHTEANRILGLIMRHWNAVIAALSEGTQAYAPLVLEREAEGHTISIIDEWCFGYYKGIDLDRGAWEPLMTAHPEWFSVILRYGALAESEELKHYPDDLDQHQACAESLPTSAIEIYRYWLAIRTQQRARGEAFANVRPHEPFRRGEKVGRNDPCPCGSGKKFKRCHGVDDSWQSAPPFASSFDRTQTDVSVEDDDVELVRSPLCQRVTRDGHTVDIEIYEDGEAGWLLEVVDAFGTSTVWDVPFPTDAAALAEALSTIHTEGIAAVMGPAPPETTRH